MDTRKLIVKHGEGAASDVYYTVDENGVCVTGWMPKADAEEIARRWNAFPLYENALRQITKGEGRFSTNQLSHAANTIEDMRTLAVEALNEVAYREGVVIENFRLEEDPKPYTVVLSSAEPDAEITQRHVMTLNEHDAASSARIMEPRPRESEKWFVIAIYEGHLENLIK